MRAAIRLMVVLLSPLAALLIYLMGWPKVWQIVPAMLAALLLLDFLVVYHCLDTISFFRGDQNLWRAFFKVGVTWDELRGPTKRYERIIREMERQAADASYPWFDRESVRDSLRKRGLERTLRLLPKPPPPTPFGE